MARLAAVVLAVVTAACASAPARPAALPPAAAVPAFAIADDTFAYIAGRTLGLLDISKPRGNVFLDRVEELLRERGAEVERFTKPTFTKPAPVDLRHQIATRCHAVIEALAD